MGVTIHFEGKLKTQNDLESVFTKGHEFAKRKSSDVIQLDSNHKLLQRVKDEVDWDYEGEVKGIQFQVHESADPLILEFDRDLYIQEYCKTQFAGISTHIEVIEFLKEIEPHFQTLIVTDEGEYWDTFDRKVLEEHFKKCFYAFDEAIKENPKLNGPYKINGRIIDLMG